MSAVLKSKWMRRLALAAGLVAVYAFLGFVVAPRVVRNEAISFVKQEYGRDLRLGEVRVNPFLLQLDVRDLSLPDADGRPMVAFRRLFVDFEAASLWHGAYTFKSVIIEAPRVESVIRPGGAFNLADLAPRKGTSKAAAPGEKQPLPGIWLQSLVVSDGAFGFVDRNRPTPFERRFAPVAFTLKDFRTTREGGGFRLAARSERGEGFEWSGRFEVEPELASHGDLAIHGLKAHGISEFLGDALPFGITAGAIDVVGHYDVALAGALRARLDIGKVEVSGLSLRARGVDADWVQVPSIVVSGTSVVLPERRATIAGIRIAGAHVQAWMGPDGSINLAQLVQPAPAQAGATPSSPGGAPTGPAASIATEPAKPTGTTPDSGAAGGWQLQVSSTEVSNATIDFEDRLKEPVKKFLVTPLNVRVTDASLDLARPVSVSLDTVVNGVAPFKAEGTVTPSPLAADLAVSLSGARMQILQPYVLPLADLTITDGRLTVEGKIKLSPPRSQEPQLRFDGDVTIDDFASVDNALKQDLVNFKRVEVRKLAYAKGPDSVKVDRVLVRQPFARVIISPERVINVLAVLDPEGTRKALEARRAEAALEAAMTPAERREREAAAEQAAKAREAHHAPSEPMAPLPAEGVPIRVREVVLEQGTLDFADHHIQPNFAAKVTDLHGAVTGLSSDPRSHATVNLEGQVGEFSPVAIKGEVQPFSFERYADLSMKFANISLPIFNPYSGELAGYAIAKGKLTTDLHYRIQDRRLDAQHHIRIEQLEWGERTASKDEATLPVKFATVLLRDENGVIDLDVPVKGTLGDPTFRIGPIVWKIIRNIIVKAVTAPFKLLGALFAGAEESQFVDFAPGRADLDAATVEHLGVLAKSLVAKPGLGLDIPVGALDALDGPALREQAYQAALADAATAVIAPPRKKGGARPPFDSLAADDKIDVLTALVKTQTGAEPKIPEPPAPSEGTSRADAKAMKQAAAIEYLEKAARSNVTIPETATADLAEARATAVQHALLAGSGLDPTRVFLVKNGKVTGKDGKVRFELALK